MAAMTGNAIQEALEPFARAATGVGAIYRDEDRVSHTPHVSMILTVGDLRRARTAYDAIGSGEKVLEWMESGADNHSSAHSELGLYVVSQTRSGNFRVFVLWIDPGGNDADREICEAGSLLEAKAAAQADFERRVRSCLSPVAVEEADAKAVGPWHGMASAPRDGTYILASGLDFGTGPRRHFTVCLCLEGTDTFVEAEGGEELTYLDAWVPLPGAALLSTHTAAGAGPVAGDYVLVPREPTEAMIDAADRVRPLPPHYLADAYRAMLAAALSTHTAAGAGPVGEAVGEAVAVRDWLLVAKAAGEHGVRYRTNRALEGFLSSVLPALARPGEEPGEVERKLRERLDKMLRPLREDLANACSSETIVRRYHVQCVDAALAALTGDAQEAGK